MNGKNYKFQKWPEVPLLGGSGTPRPLISQILSCPKGRILCIQAYLNHGLNKAIQKKIRSHQTEKSFKTVEYV